MALGGQAGLFPRSTINISTRWFGWLVPLPEPVCGWYSSFLEEEGRMTQCLPPKALPLPPAAFLPFTLKAVTGWSKWSRFAISFQSTYLIKVNELLI